MTTGQRLKQAREALKIGQSEMAEDLGYTHPAAISRIENDHSGISLRTLKLLETRYSIRPEFILFGDGEMFNHAPIDADKMKTIKSLEDIASRIDETIKKLKV